MMRTDGEAKTLVDAGEPTPPAAPPFGRPVTFRQAVNAVDSAVACAQELGVPMAIAVVETTGDLVYFCKMDGAPYSAVELSQQKAVAAARYRRDTKAFFDALVAGHSFYATFPGVCLVPGGIPLVVDGLLIGAIGVSGGNVEQDLMVANAGTAGRPTLNKET